MSANRLLQRDQYFFGEYAIDQHLEAIGACALSELLGSEVEDVLVGTRVVAKTITAVGSSRAHRFVVLTYDAVIQEGDLERRNRVVLVGSVSVQQLELYRHSRAKFENGGPVVADRWLFDQ